MKCVLFVLITHLIGLILSATYSKTAPTLLLANIEFKPDEPLDIDNFYGHDVYIENANGTIHPLTFSSIPRIINFMMYHSKLLSFDLTSLHQMTYLSSVTINNVTGLPVLTNRIMEGFLNLTKLIIYDADIKFDYDTFQNADLIYLSVTKVDVAILGNNLFTGSKLEELYWTDTGLEKIDRDCFSPLKRLKILNASRNKLKILDAGTFRGLKNLEAIYLSGNKLSALDWRVFENLPSLNYLDVSKNQLEEVKEDAILYHVPTLINLVINRGSLIPREFTEFDVNLHVRYT